MGGRGSRQVEGVVQVGTGSRRAGGSVGGGPES